MALVLKNWPANAGDIRDVGSIPGLGRSPGEGNGNPVQYSCLENPIDRRTWQATVHGIAKHQTRLKQLSTNTLNIKDNKCSARVLVLRKSSSEDLSFLIHKAGRSEQMTPKILRQFPEPGCHYVCLFNLRECFLHLNFNHSMV